MTPPTNEKASSIETLTALMEQGRTPVEKLAYAERLVKAQAAAIEAKNALIAKMYDAGKQTPQATTTTTTAKTTTAPAMATRAEKLAAEAAAVAEYNRIDVNDAKARAAYREAHAAELGLK